MYVVLKISPLEPQFIAVIGQTVKNVLHVVTSKLTGFKSKMFNMIEYLQTVTQTNSIVII